MSISVITPTFGRPDALPNLYHAFATQHYAERELLVYDDSPVPSESMQRLAAADRRVRYFHRHERATIGEKRNFLIERAKHNIVCHFDDDDYYAPTYLSTLAAALEEHDVVKLSAWYNFSPRSQVLAYWDCQSALPFGFSLSPTSGLEVVQNAEHPGNTWGYGFSYMYRRRVWEAVAFDRRSFGEDYDFVSRALAAGFKGRLHADTAGVALHIIHATNTSRAFPQFLLPPFMLQRIFGEDLQRYAKAEAFTHLNLTP